MKPTRHCCPPATITPEFCLGNWKCGDRDLVAAGNGTEKTTPIDYRLSHVRFI